MNLKFRRVIVWVLLLSLILSLVPAVVLTAFADDTHDESHTLSDWTVVSDDNSKCQRHCTIEGCDYSEVQDHDFTDAEPKDGENHTLQCKNCEHQEYKAHTYDQKVIKDTYRQSDDAYFYSCACGAKGSDTFPVHTVIFKPDFDGAEPKTVVAEADAAVNEPADVTKTREGYRFDGWYMGETEFTPGSTVSASCTVTAKWVQTFTITFDKGDVASINETLESITVDKDAVATAPAAPTTSVNKQFKEWSYSVAQWDFTMPVTQNVTVTAEWVDTYNVTVDTGITNGTVTVDPNKAAEGDTVTVTVTPDTGYELDTLTYTEEDSTAPINILETKTIPMPAKAVTVTAAFKISDFALEAASAGDLFVGSTTQLSTSTGIIPASWESDDSTVATVSNTGLVTGVKAGNAMITAKVDDEHTASVSVTVVDLSLSLAAKTVSGKTGAALPTGLKTEKLILSLANGSFAEAPGKADIAVSPLPAGVDYEVTKLTHQKIAVVFNGTPTAVCDSAITVSVKKEALVNPPATPAQYTVTNTATKWNIVKSVPITLDNGGAASADIAKGTVKISPEVAAPGDNVTVAVTPKAPFKLKSIAYTVGSTTQTIEAINGEYTFKMPEDASAATITVTYEMAHTSKAGECNSKIKSFSLADHEGLKNAIVSNSSSVSVEGAVSAAQKDALANGGDYAFVLYVDSATSASDKTKLDTATKVSSVKGAVYTGDNKYMDITLWFSVYDAEGEEVGDPIQITDTGTYYVSLAFDALRSPATRLYYVHNGGAAAYYSQESGSTNGNVKYTKLHLFSTYELVYTTTTDNPKTADPFHLPVWAAVFVLSGLALPAVILGGRKHLL